MCVWRGRKWEDATLGSMVWMDARARSPWYTTSIFGDADVAAVKVCGAGARGSRTGGAG